MNPLALAIGGAVLAAVAAVGLAKYASKEIGAAVQSFLGSNNQPCTSFVASFIASRIGIVPEDPTSWESWWGAAGDLWEAISIWDASDPWSGVKWVSARFGGPALYAENVTSNDQAPQLDVGVDYMVQLWWSSSGHAIIVTPLEDGTFRVRDSNTSRGYQDRVVDAWAYSGADVGASPILA